MKYIVSFILEEQLMLQEKLWKTFYLETILSEANAVCLFGLSFLCYLCHLHDK